VSLDYWKVHSLLRELHGGLPPRRTSPSGTGERHGDNGVELEYCRSSVTQPHGTEKLRAHRLRECAAQGIRGETLDQGWWRKLAVGAARRCPNFVPGEVYARFSDGSVTKTLDLLGVVERPGRQWPACSATRLNVEWSLIRSNGEHCGGKKERCRRASTTCSGRGRASSMSTLALFWPHPTLRGARGPAHTLERRCALRRRRGCEESRR